MRVSEALTITPSALSDAVSGNPVTVPGQFSGGGALSAVVVPMNFREADERICKSIGVDRDRGAAVMAKLWGRTLSDERDHRAEPGANAQGKGQVSRQLKAELLRAVSDGND